MKRFIPFLFLLLTIHCFSQQSNAKKYSLRKYKHVKEFYSGLSAKATQMCLDNNIPPASLLAIAGLESGWNQGYIGRITGNILSLGARKRDTQLPGLYLPHRIKTNKVLFDSITISKIAPKTLQWKQRPKSLKIDYRPKPWAGTPYQLSYFKNHPAAKNAAHLANINDFVTGFIGRKSRLKAYRNTRKKMDSLVIKHGKDILLEEATAIQFIHGIGGKVNSYNFRKTWPIKVISIIRNAGLTTLTKRLDNGEQFDRIW